MEKISYKAFKGLTDKEFEGLPSDVQQMVPDKCRFCRWMITCDPLKMCLATGVRCDGFEFEKDKKKG